MIEKRQALVDWFQSILGIDFKIADRLRSATFQSKTRAERVRIMGEPTKYCEILWQGVGEGTQLDSVGDSVLDGHLFRINLWFEFRDDDIYEESSQYKFDNLLEGDNGLLKTIRDTAIIPDAPELMYLYHPAEVNVTEVSLDREGKELAHFVTFQLSVR